MKFEEILGPPILTISLQDLKSFRKRISSKDTNSRWLAMRRFGAYCIEFTEGVYIGSTGGGAMYFARRWRQHLCAFKAQKSSQQRLIEAFNNTVEAECFFHILQITNTHAEANLAEWLRIVKMERAAPGSLINPHEGVFHSERERSPTAERTRRISLDVRRRILNGDISATGELLL